MSALAQANLFPENPGLPGSQGVGANDFIIVIIQWLLGVAGIVAVLFIIIGGFQYITSAGNEELAEHGKKNITNAIIGLVVIILSYIIVTVVINALI